MLHSRPRTTGTITALVASLVFGQPLFAFDDCHDEEWMTFEGWEGWEAITASPVISYAHGENWVGIFANEIASETYKAATAPFPECSAIVKSIYTDMDGSAVRKLTIMVKMPAGYDPDHGDWWYGDSESTGTVISEGGRREDCMSCHEVAIETDYVFSDDVMETVREWNEWRE